MPAGFRAAWIEVFELEAKVWIEVHCEISVQDGQSLSFLGCRLVFDGVKQSSEMLLSLVIWHAAVFSVGYLISFQLF